MESPQYASCLATNPEKLQRKRGARRERGPVGNTHPSFWKQSSGPFPGPLFLPLLSSRPSIQGPGLIISGDENRQSSASPARPVRALVLCVLQHLMCLHCVHSSYPHLNSKVSFLLSSRAVNTGTILVLYSLTALALPWAPEPSWRQGSGWLVKSRGPALCHLVLEAVCPGVVFLCSSSVCCPLCVGCGEQVQK